MNEKMNPEIKAKWVSALRSGDYPQTRFRLNRLVDLVDDDNKMLSGAGFCCLGVLCELAKQAGIVEYTADYDNNVGIYDGVEDVLPQNVRDWAGLNSSNPSINVSGVRERPLAVLNDGDHWNFNQIADVIEEQL